VADLKPANYLKSLDYSVVQQCIHCGLCLPTCPTYDETKLERNSPRGRIALMRSIVDDRLPVTPEFGDELYFCLGCLACVTACPAGVDYAELFEMSRAEIENKKVLANPVRSTIRGITLRFIFMHPQVLRAIGFALYLYQVSGLQRLVRLWKLTALLPAKLRVLEPLTPTVKHPFSDGRIARLESPSVKKSRVGLLTGCVQDLIYPDVNRDTVDALLANGCEVVTPRAQFCCGSLQAHNGEYELSKELAKRNIDSFDLDSLDAIITNAAGCGSHLKHYDRLLAADPIYAERARQWSAKLRDVHEWLVDCGLRSVDCGKTARVTYHEACHLCHGQQITRQPREVLKSIRGLELIELPESAWCCGSAGVYNITQPEMSAKLLARKLEKIDLTGAKIVATANPGCMVQLEAGARNSGRDLEIVHPITLLARAYAKEKGL
jgi:glycolate oxidase iron-sulfur subunit